MPEPLLQEIKDCKSIGEVITLLEKYGCLSPCLTDSLKETVARICVTYLV